MVQKLRTAVEIPTKNCQNCGQKLWMRVGRTTQPVSRRWGQRSGIVGLDIVRTFLEVQPVERTRRGQREAASPKFGDSPWKSKHGHESTDLVDCEKAKRSTTQVVPLFRTTRKRTDPTSSSTTRPYLAMR